MNETNFKIATDYFSIAVLITLSIYHLLVFLGRKDYKEEKYNMYFALFAFFIASYLSAFTAIPNSFFSDYNTSLNYSVAIEGIMSFGMCYSFCRFLSSLVSLPPKKELTINKLLFFCSIPSLLSITCIIWGYDWYRQWMFLLVMIFFSGLTIYILSIYASYIYRNKIYKERTLKIILIGLSVLISYIIVSKLLTVYSDNGFWVDNKLIYGIVVYIFAYALAQKFNNEFKELIDLKQSLEVKILERTLELEKANILINEAHREKTNYFVNLAHETKTPLTLIKNYLDNYISRKGNDNDLIIIKRNIEKLNRDMVNFLDAEKIEKGKLIYDHNQITCFSELLSENYKLFKETAALHNIEITASIQPYVYIKADPYSIDRIINNLIDNAIKYSIEGNSIKIKLKTINNKIFFSVEDQGIGIPNDKIEQIVLPYIQASTVKQNRQGIGMGLFIVKSIVNEINGSLEIESTEGLGSEFKITLNNYILKNNDFITKGIEHNILQPQNIVIQLNTEYSEDHRNIVVLEDNHEMAQYLKMELCKDYNVFVYSNGIEAFRKIHNIPKPDLIISDIMMDMMDGIEFYNLISKDANLNLTPYIFLTARNIIEEKIELLNRGAIDFISKPFSISELKAKIKSIIAAKSKLRKAGYRDAIDLLSKQLENEEIQTINDKWPVFETNCSKMGLTDRQKEIAIMVSEGLGHKEIGNKLNISDKTVIRHVQNLYEKLNVHNKVDLLNLLFSR